VDIKSNPGNTEISKGACMNRETTNISTAIVILIARKKSRNPAGKGISISPSISIKPSANTISVFLPNIFISNYIKEYFSF
jgi:hypothetical protein